LQRCDQILSMPHSGIDMEIFCASITLGSL
jgi:hypothetical protein